VTLPSPNPAAAFELKRQVTNGLIGPDGVGGQRHGHARDSDVFRERGVETSSLSDGRYTFSIFAAMVFQFPRKPGRQLRRRRGATTLSLLVRPPNGLFRLFGDSNGDGTVNGTDFLAFRLAFPGHKHDV